MYTAPISNGRRTGAQAGAAAAHVRACSRVYIHCFCIHTSSCSSLQPLLLCTLAEQSDLGTMAMDEGEMRKRIFAIMTDTTLSEAEKAVKRL